MKRVIVYRNHLLPSSETFIKQQILGLSEWQAILVGQDRVNNGLDTIGLELVIEKDSIKTKLDKLKKRFFHRFGWPRLGFYKSLSDYNASLVHVHFGIDAVTAWPWLKHFNIPVVITLHGYDISTKPEYWEHGEDAFMQYYPKRLHEIAIHNNVSFIAVSNAIRQKAIDLYSLPADKIKVLHIGVDEKTFTPTDSATKAKSKKILFVGRLVEKKGTAILIKAMSQVLQQVPDSELVIVGDGHLRLELEKLAKDINVPALFLGVLPSIQIRQLMQEARVFCLPSITAENGDTEGLPIVIMEAQACGTPVITSAVGGRDEGIAEGTTGFAFDEGDVSGLISHLIRLLNDDELTCRMSAAGPKFISENFSLAKCTAQLESHYETLVKNHHLPQENK